MNEASSYIGNSVMGAFSVDTFGQKSTDDMENAGDSVINDATFGKASEILEPSNDYTAPNPDFLAKIDKYSLYSSAENPIEKVAMKTMQKNQKDYKSNERIEILSIPKKEFNGKDFFARQEFRGLFLADHQEALGKKAFDCVDNLN